MIEWICNEFAANVLMPSALVNTLGCHKVNTIAVNE
jgi:Zn-dependent peptidase ImmA (M78 family)